MSFVPLVGGILRETENVILASAGIALVAALILQSSLASVLRLKAQPLLSMLIMAFAAGIATFACVWGTALTT
jgi:hypothetical protein